MLRIYDNFIHALYTIREEATAKGTKGWFEGVDFGEPSGDMRAEDTAKLAFLRSIGRAVWKVEAALFGEAFIDDCNFSLNDAPLWQAKAYSPVNPLEYQFDYGRFMRMNVPQTTHELREGLEAIKEAVAKIAPPLAEESELEAAFNEMIREITYVIENPKSRMPRQR